MFDRKASMATISPAMPSSSRLPIYRGEECYHGFFTHTMVLPGAGIEERRFDWPAAHVRKSEHTVGESVSHAEQSLIAAAACLLSISDFQPLALNGMHLAPLRWMGSAIKCPSHEGARHKVSAVQRFVLKRKG
jgi:hypothetical protein